ncbi:hypothetical protein SDC9_180926 [bioreactor metagenome]|uniref:Uncharacterized protein n=1 Tax=bioreactor metagenome TaxID=1076179 RepID=A0A645H5T8_9ZZZZ
MSPFDFSEPMFARAILGDEMFITLFKYTSPIMAKSYKNSGLESTLAPESISNENPPFMLGISVPMAGLSMPLILPITKVAPASSAPVEPADTIASASPFLT